MKPSSEFILAQWEGSVTWYGGVMTSTGVEEASRREKGEDDISWTDAQSVPSVYVY
jgi:hypothetical protein